MTFRNSLTRLVSGLYIALNIVFAASNDLVERWPQTSPMNYVLGNICPANTLTCSSNSSTDTVKCAAVCCDLGRGFMGGCGSGQECYIAGDRWGCCEYGGLCDESYAFECVDFGGYAGDYTFECPEDTPTCYTTTVLDSNQVGCMSTLADYVYHSPTPSTTSSASVLTTTASTNGAIGKLGKDSWLAVAMGIVAL